MNDTLRTLSLWLENTPWGLAIRGSWWIFPIIEWAHLVGLAVVLATSVAVDLCLLGLGKRQLTPAELSNGLFAWNWIGMGVAIFAGFLLFSSDATTYMSNAGFHWKLGVFIPLAMTWHVVVQAKTAAWSQTEETPMLGKMAGLLEILLWTSVVTASVYFLLTNAVTHP